MGLFDLFHHDEPRPDPLAGGADGFFDVLDDDGRLVRYVPDDFDEIWTTTDVHEAGHHVSIGWLLLDEVVGSSDDPGHEEFRQVNVYTGSPGGAGFAADAGIAGLPGSGFSKRTVPVHVDSRESVTTYILGYLKPGREGSPVDTSGAGTPTS